MKILLFGALVFQLFIIVFSQYVNPLKDPYTCGIPSCSPATSKFKYSPEKYQSYKYSVEARSIFNSTSKNESTLYIESKVNLNFLTPCDGLLTLSDVTLRETTPRDNEENPDSTNSQLFADMITEYTLRFAFKDGDISELCPQAEEKGWPLNFKRGVLSMLQNSMKRFDLDWTGQEEDVRGVCPTSYRVIGAKETSLLIEKTKDLDSCVGREQFNSVVQSTPLSNFQSRTKSKGILKSSSHCVLSIDHNIYSEITCQENFLLEPFSNNAAGASTTVIQKLGLKDEGKFKMLDEQNEISRRTSLKFDHSIPKQPTNGDLKTTRDLIKKLCKESQSESQSDFSNLFGKFIYGIRSLGYPALASLYSHTKTTCPSAKKHLLDALSYASTAGSVSLMKDIILSGTLPESTLNDWMMSLAFIPNPDIDMMKSALIILQGKSFSPNIALSISALTHTYCSVDSDCQSREVIDSIVKYYENHLLSMIETGNMDRQTHDNIIVTLKALSSIGLISENFEEELFKLVGDSNLDVGIRVAAVETFRRLPCENSRRYFENIYEDQNEDSEVRIAAYLQVMRCPNYLLVRTIAYNLRNEGINQVGSFVWSHLHNIIKSTNPLKVEIQSLLSEEDLVKKFSNDIRKFSHNRESSLYFDEYNIGGNYESNVIFSPLSYIPRTAMLNLTVDLFGKSVNLLEVYGRVEGFERYLESLFGPKGKSNIIKDRMKAFKTRWTREAKENDFAERKVQELADIANKITDEPKVSLGFKMFGNDLKYATFNGGHEIQNALESFNLLTYLKHILSGKEIIYKKAAMFLDSNYVVPSGAGLPLFISAIGTASINIKLFGSLKAAGFSKNKELDLVANFEPTASTDISAEMSLGAFYGSTGIKLKTNMYTSSAVKGDLKIRGTKLVGIKFSMPKKNMKIFGARSELLVKQNNIENPQKGLNANTVSHSLCSWPTISETIGLKLCFDYSFKNATKIFTAPYFLLAGPANLQIYMNKSDPTANVYLFEYKWTQGKDLSVVSFTFDTPGSAVKRLIHANFTIDKESHNLTMLMQSSTEVVLARGRLKNTDDEKFLQVALDINNKKHFDASIAYERLKKTNGYTYKPRVYLGVNGERVMELQGSIDLISKKDISQYTVDLKFHTKRLTSKLFGYISKTDSSIGTDLSLDYKFVNTKEQRVSLQFTVANRSKKNIAVIVGTCNLQSTAYPNYNFYSNVTFQRSGSHMEFKVGLIQNPLPLNDPNAEFESLKLDFIFTHKAFTDSKQTIKAVTNIKRESTNLDLKALVFYENINADINLECIVNYGNNKQVSVTVFWSHPRTTLEEIKAHVNVTVPSFSPMVLKLEISEKQSKEYKLDVSGTWFSGHSAHAVGFYQDRGTTVSSNHHVKLFIKSPNFKDVNSDFLFYRDNDMIKIDIKAIHDEYDYQIFLNHNMTSNEEMHTNAKLKYKTKLYTLSTAVNTGEHIKITAEMHIDQLRDIEFSIWIFNEDTQRAMGFDINWDANRDPNQKLLVAANFTRAADFNYNADVIVSYPGRTIIGKYQFLLQKGHIDMLASISWDDGKSFAINLNVIYRYENEIFFEISSRLNTPLDHWKNLKLMAIFEHLHNKYSLNGALTWDIRQKVAVYLYGDYIARGSYLDCKYSCSVLSTLDSIPNVNTTVKHMQNGTDYNTNIRLMYNPEFLIDVESKWMLQTNNNFSNITGTVKTQTPFQGLRKGLLLSKIYLTNNKYLRGVADLDIDHKKMVVDMEGKFKHLMDSMFIANITTPDEKYQCNFKLSKKEKHIVALLTYPTGLLGTEVLFFINNLTNFDIKFLMATPVEFLQNVMVVGSLQTGQADFRVGWNSLLLGFSGVWHYANIIDFEYSYKIYTPIKDFEENGVVGKLIVKEGLDFEICCKLSLYKLGGKLIGKPKPKPLKELGINVREVYYSKPPRNSDKDDDFLSWEGLLEVDAIIFPTIKGQLEIDQKGSVYILQSKIHLPHGVATIFDEFEYIDILSMSNDLRIVTPYKDCKSIASTFQLNVIPSQKYLVGLECTYENNSRLIKTGIFVEYNVDRKEIDERIYNVTLEVNTPFKAFPKLNLFGAFETEENFYHTKLLFNTNASDLSLDATTEIDENWIGITSDFYAKTPIIIIPQCQLRLTKLISFSSNYVELRLKIPERFKSEVYFKTSWLIRRPNQFRTIVQLESPFKGFENTTAGVDMIYSSLKSTLWAYVNIKPIEFEVNSSFSDNVLISNSVVHFNDNRFPVNINCKILTPSLNQREFNGTLLLKDKVFEINGNANLIGDLPVKVLITFTPQDNSAPLTFQYNLETTLKGYELVGVLHYVDRLTHFSGQAMANDKFNWEVYLQVEPPNSTQKMSVHAIAKSVDNGAGIDITGNTHIPKLEYSKFGAKYSIENILKKAHGYFELTHTRGSIDIELIWEYLENMFLRATGKYQNSEYASKSSFEAFYRNPDKQFEQLITGGDIKIDSLWETGANATLKLPEKNNANFEGHLKIPNDFKETHSLFAELSYGEKLKFIDYLLKYRSTFPIRKYGSWAKVSLENKQNISVDAVIEWDGKEMHNNANLKRLNKSAELFYKLKSSQYGDKQLFVAEVNHKEIGEHHKITCNTFYPEDLSLAYGTIDYIELANMYGMFNITIPYKALNFTGANFSTETNNNVYNRYVKLFWGNDTAVLDSKCDIKAGNTIMERNYTGKIIVELPLATRHIGNVDYEYDKKAELSTGQATVEYNGENVLEGKYNCQSESRAGLEMDKIHVELLNKMVPVGADYVNRHESGAPRDGYSAPTVDNKHLHLYHLQNRSKFNLTGEMDVKTHSTGQEYVLSATHLNRKVTVWTDYAVLSQEYKQHSRIELSPTVWVEYDLSLVNKTKHDNFDAQMFLINMSYPRRNFIAQGFYNISDSIVSTDVSLAWDKNNKSVQAAVDWRRIAMYRERLQLLLKHPSFQRDVTFVSEYGYTNSSLDGELVIDYSTNPDQRVSLGLRANDKSKVETYNYTYNIWAEHNATNLYLNCFGHVHWSPSKCGTEHIADYKRSYLSLSRSQTLAKADFELRDAMFKKEGITGLSYFWGRYGGSFPVYTANISSIHGINHTLGKFYINFEEKLLYLNVNLTKDGSQSIHSYGIIPDARSARFDIWRDYEDKRLTDMSYYLKLNHSRLIMSSLRWRPELISDVQNGIRSKALQLYYETLEEINNTRQYIRAESLDAIDGIWQESRPIVQSYLVDLRNLTVIDEDIEHLKTFLNKSYYANEFYIKDICTIILTMFDELSLKSHLQSVPKIFQELWTAMGASGQSIKQSINFVIDKVKLYYASTTQFIHDLINGDPIKHLSNMLERLVDKYDDFIKSVHVSVLQYMEKLWSETYELVVENWHQTLAALEPTFLKFVHYLETIVWTTGKEFLDFLYIRKNKIIESAYFMEFTKFSRDVDRFYKDITGNNTVESIYKYSNIAWSFLNEKYINHIPFGKELKAIGMEIWAELKQLEDIPSIKYVVNKYCETLEIVKYYYKYFEVEYQLHRFIRFIYSKFSEMTITALELENRQREAKTKFVYEPNEGIMLMEQKLPMSWHAFNETPKFQEIPEIKMFYGIYNYLATSEASFWNFYYDYKPYTEPSEWLPPFKGHAMLMGVKYYVTFDKKYYDFRGSCTYLLTTDFVDRNFTLLVSYDDMGISSQLVLLINKTIVYINLFEDTVKIEGYTSVLLPMEIGDNRLYREADMVTLESRSGFVLQCNMKFQVCIFEISGWHFARTTGLWGTYNNEPFDDIATPTKIYNSSDLSAFGDRWSTDENCKTKTYLDNYVVQPISKEIAILCNEFFNSKLSDLSTCFPRIAKDNYLEMCMNSTTHLEACRIAIGYIEMCARENTPLSIPDSCIMCSLLNGTEIQEGDFVRLQGDAVPQMADVVFIIEAKRCNKDLKNHKNFNIVVESINRELLELNITNNRYAVVVFGGNGVFNAPRSIVLNSRTFTDANSVSDYFNNIPFGNGNSDIYNAITFANKLMFRPGVSRNLILVPCSECQEHNMQHDYSVVHQLLFENSVSLHILMDSTFTVQGEARKRDNKIPFGVDLYKAYTKKDIKKLDGDQVLRDSISLPKSTLGLCFSLALETNGTIFSSKHLEVQKNAKKFSTVFAKRVARSALPKDCTDCECASLPTGVSFMECYPCTYPRSNMEHHSYYDEDDIF